MNDINRVNKQLNCQYHSGATMWTTLFLILVIGFIGLLAVKLLPIYIEHKNVRASMQEIVNRSDFQGMTRQQILSTMSKRMMIDSIRGIGKEAFKVSREKSGRKFIVIDYSQKTLIMSNVSALIEFKEEIKPQRK